ncbi:MAG: helix-turn-helix domain-containing protein [Candidatus Cybelea sp.]
MGNAAGPSSFGALLRGFRLAAGLSQAALAERAAMSPDGVSALERGINKAPQRETLALLLGALQLNPQQSQAIEAAAARPSRPRISVVRSHKKHNLPRLPSPLFGRERELSEIENLVAGSQVVTLTGTGGVGKTRLAIEAGYAAQNAFDDGVWFIDLAAVRDPGDVPSALAYAFSVRARPDATPLDAVAETLARKKMLLIVDNCEHIVTAAAAAVEKIESECADVRILATSRQPLEVAGERTYRLASLSGEASVELFAEVATRSDPAFSFGDELPIVERICRRLDGIALAIELAAARVKLISLSQIEELLSERFAVLSGGGRIARHQTMHALVDWSYDLLSEEEQALFGRLSVFPAEFSLEAVLAVCSGDGITKRRVLDILGSLVDKSLLTTERRGKVRRFRLLETIGAYALEKLGARIGPLNRLHALYYLKFVDSVDWSNPNFEEVLEAEYHNLRRAVEWAIDEGGDAELGVRLLAGMREFLLLRGFGADTARRARRALAGPAQLPKPIQAMAWETIAGMLGDLLLPSQAFEAGVHMLQLYEELGDQAGVGRSLRARGIAELRLGRYAEAEENLRRSLELSKAHGSRRDVLRALGSVGLAFAMTGRSAEGRQTTLESLEMARQLGDQRILWIVVVNLAEAEFGAGEVESAVRRLEELLDGRTIRKNTRLRANVKSNLAAYLIALQREDDARALARAAVLDAREAGDNGIMACAIGTLATLRSRSDPRVAARLIGYVDEVFSAGYIREYTERYTQTLLMERLHQTLGDDEIAALAREGAAMTESQAVRLATHAGRPSVARGRP